MYTYIYIYIYIHIYTRMFICVCTMYVFDLFYPGAASEENWNSVGLDPLEDASTASWRRAGEVATRSRQQE